MSKTEAHNQHCPSCCHFGFCQVKWGVDCKRQGGNKIPRMKSMTGDARNTANLTNYQKPIRKDKTAMAHKPSKAVMFFEPIRTRATNW